MTDTPSLKPNPVSLTGAQRRALRALGHALKPIVRIGRNGVTDGIVGATAAVLDDHELIKVSLAGESEPERREEAEELARRTGSHVAQVIGRVGLLYRRRHDDPEVALPGPIEEGPR